MLNMHLHWKKHETVKVVCRPCRPGQVHAYAEEISRLSKGVIIDITGDQTIIFYRGKNYVQPQVMSPPGTLSKQKVLSLYQRRSFSLYPSTNLISCATLSITLPWRTSLLSTTLASSLSLSLSLSLSRSLPSLTTMCIYIYIYIYMPTRENLFLSTYLIIRERLSLNLLWKTSFYPTLS